VRKNCNADAREDASRSCVFLSTIFGAAKKTFEASL
jgi:hypothetical protein